MSREYKASRPDPVEILEEMRDLMAEVNTHRIQLDQYWAECQDFNERQKEALKPWKEEANARTDHSNGLRTAYENAKEKYVLRSIDLMAVIIEDMKG